MKIPGLDDALAKLDVFEDTMIPLLERIADNTDAMAANLVRMVELAESQQEWNDRNDGGYR